MKKLLLLLSFLTVTIIHALTLSGMEWNVPNNGTNSDVRLRWTSPPPRWPMTILWKYRPKQQTGFYATFWYTAATEAFTGASYYQGGLPYPPGGSGGTTHKWEIASDGNDFTSTQDVVKGVWYPQAMTSTLDGSGNLNLAYFWAVDSGTSVSTWEITHQTTAANLSSCTCTATATGGGAYILELGASPWRSNIGGITGNNDETLYGFVRDIQIFDTTLSAADIATEMAVESNSAQTAVGARHLWYSNVDPIPTDVTDKKTGGTAHDPSWANTLRPIQWDTTITSASTWGDFGNNDIFLLKFGL